MPVSGQGGGHWALMPLKLLADAKQRLAPALNVQERQALVLAMAADVLAALTGCEAFDQVLIVSRNKEADELAERCGAAVFAEPADAHLPGALRAGAAAAVAAGAATVSMIPADVPAVTSAELLAAARSHCAITIAPDAHCEGTNLLMLSPPQLIEPIFDGRSFAPHLRAATAVPAPTQVLRSPGLSLDIDTPDDLAALAKLPGAPATRRALAAMGRG